MRHIVAALLAAAIVATPLAAQNAPTLAETAAWLELDGMRLLGGAVAQSELRLDTETCVLSFAWQARREPMRTVVPLRLVDPRSIAVSHDDFFGGLRVQIRASAEAGRAILSTELKSKKPQPLTTNSADLYVRSAADGERLANAIQHAAVLCGASVGAF